jgi:hypothetical protein
MLNQLHYPLFTCCVFGLRFITVIAFLVCVLGLRFVTVTAIWFAFLGCCCLSYDISIIETDLHKTGQLIYIPLHANDYYNNEYSCGLQGCNLINLVYSVAN